MSLRNWLATLLSHGSSAQQSDPVAASTFSSTDLYAAEFATAWQFSAQKYPEPNMRAAEERDPKLRPLLVQHALMCLTDDIFVEMNKQVDPVYAYGTQCANVHLHVLQGLRRNFPYESFHLTLGGVTTAGNAAFPYTMADFQADVVKRPDRVRGHAWITCGDRFIIDLTLGTYLVNKPDATGQYGPAIHGEMGRLASTPFKGGRRPDLALTYHPVAVGTAPILATAPSYDQWARA
jgi:hypothetical protein